MHPANSLHLVLNSLIVFKTRNRHFDIFIANRRNLRSSLIGFGISSLRAVYSVEKYFHSHLCRKNFWVSFLHLCISTSLHSRLSCIWKDVSHPFSSLYSSWQWTSRLTAMFSCMRRFSLKLPSDTFRRTIDFVRVAARNQGVFLQYCTMSGPQQWLQQDKDGPGGRHVDQNQKISIVCMYFIPS